MNAAMSTPSMSSSTWPSVKGVELNIICGGIPVITLDKACDFHENVSWMLQSALNATGKADSLYEYVDDDRVIKEARKLGLTEDELGIVRLKAKELRHVKAVGTTGKRSVMLAVVVALALEDPDNAMDALWKELRAYKLGKAFVKLLESGLQAVHKKGSHDADDWDSGWDNSGWMSGDWRGGGGRERESSATREKASASHRPSAAYAGGGGGRREQQPVEPSDGIDLSVVCGMVPVLDLDKSSIFHENVSWLLQTAMDSSGKADSLYDFCNDREIIAACRKEIRLSDQDIGLVQLKRNDLQHIRAVGTAGKRSIMLAVVVALVLHNEVQCDDLQAEVWAYDRKLYKPLDQLVRAAKYLAAGGKRSSGGDGGSARGFGGYDAADLTSRSKRKQMDDDDDWGDWDYSAKAQKTGAKLDKQLDDYWGDEDWSSFWQPPAREKTYVAGRAVRGEESNSDSLDKMLTNYWSDKDRRTTHSERDRDD